MLRYSYPVISILNYMLQIVFRNRRAIRVAVLSKTVFADAFYSKDEVNCHLMSKIEGNRQDLQYYD